MDVAKGYRPRITSICAIPSCVNEVVPSHHMCASHWDLIPAYEKAHYYRIRNDLTRSLSIRLRAGLIKGITPADYLEARAIKRKLIESGELHPNV